MYQMDGVLKKRVEAVRSKMTLEQKCGLLSGKTAFGSREYIKLGVPSMHFSDGPHGLRKQEEGANHLGIGGSMLATCFPTAATVASSWDPELGEKLGAALGEEALEQNVQVILGPGMNIKKNPKCGRNFEYFSEDPYLTGKMAAGYVRGIQSKGTSACPKHFAVNSQEMNRMSVDAVVDERTLREIYLTAFEIVVKEAHPEMLMSAYNRVNEQYANENAHLLVDILKTEWGYQGTMVTDWGGSNDHVEGVRLGSHFEMPSPGLDPVMELAAAVKTGKLSEKMLDQRVEEALEIVFATHEAYENAKNNGALKSNSEKRADVMPSIENREFGFDAEAHHTLAREIAGQSMTLLRNQDSILPLSAGAKVALIGDMADVPRYQGAGSSMVNPTFLHSIKEMIGKYDLNCIGYAQGYLRCGKSEEKLAVQAEEMAEKADTIIYVMGLDEQKESEGLDRSSLKVNKNQIDLLKRIFTKNSNVVVVFCGGASVESPWTAYSKAMLYACLGGQAGAEAVLDILTGKINPSGKLAETWVDSYADIPFGTAYPSVEKSLEYREGIYVGYRYYDKVEMHVSFPFGYGLSYTRFSYSDLKISEDGVHFTITNVGERDGAEVAQMYVSKTDAKVFRPVRELKGFTKVFLKAGESRQIMIPFDSMTFRYYDIKRSRWNIEPGKYCIYVGTSSRELLLNAETVIAGSAADSQIVLAETIIENAEDTQIFENRGDSQTADFITPYEGLKISSYESGHVTEVTDEEFENLLGHSLPSSKVVIDRNITFRQLIHGRSPVFWIVSVILSLLVNGREKKKKDPSLNLLFIYNMPLRALQKNAGTFFSMGMVDALVMEIQGFWIIGLVRFIIEFFVYQIKCLRMRHKL